MVRLGLGYSMLILGAANLALGAYQMFIADLLNNEKTSSIRPLVFSLCLIYVGKTWIRPEQTTTEPCR